MAEFTGERVIPGKVDIDLWNEHLSRYLFAARLCRFKRVIDLGCGSGYGAVELARQAEHVTAVDISPEAIAEARELYSLPNLSFEVASLDHLPFSDASFQLGVCFEVIEHLENYRDLLAEARRVLAPGGQLVISTPNLDFYAESRKKDGPNPFHVHEFRYEEFREALSEFFEYQTFFVQNHSSGIVFLPLANAAGSELRLEANPPRPEEAHFLLAVCAAKPLLGAPSFVYMPSSANVLREREHHIARLEAELNTKNEWLDQVRAEHKTLVDQFRNLKQELEARNQWALEQDARVTEAQAAVTRLENELANQHQEAAQVVSAYEQRLKTVESEAADLARWHASNQAALEKQMGELSSHIQKLDGEIARAASQLSEYQKKLDETESVVIERTQWAQREQAAREASESKLSAVEASRWIRMGKAFGLGPKLS